MRPSVKLERFDSTGRDSFAGSVATGIPLVAAPPSPLLCPCCGHGLRIVAASAVVEMDGRWVLYPVCPRCHRAITKRPASAFARLLAQRAQRHLTNNLEQFGGRVFVDQCEATCACGLIADREVGGRAVSAFWSGRGVIGGI